MGHTWRENVEREREGEEREREERGRREREREERERERKKERKLMKVFLKKYHWITGKERGEKREYI